MMLYSLHSISKPQSLSQLHRDGSDSNLDMCKELKKGIYINGHKHPNVIKERSEFVEEILNRFS